MYTQDNTVVDDAFGHWLAGFADGESWFAILHHRDREAYHCQFGICLRDDDGPILEEIQRRTGLGILGRKVYQASWAGTGSKPQARWVIHRKEECLALIEIFDRYPLRAKKARDYAIWREAVLEWERWTNKRAGTRQRSAYVNWSRMAQLRQQLKDVRAYPDDEVRIALPIPMPDPQLILENW